MLLTTQSFIWPFFAGTFYFVIGWPYKLFFITSKYILSVSPYRIISIVNSSYFQVDRHSLISFRFLLMIYFVFLKPSSTVELVSCTTMMYLHEIEDPLCEMHSWDLLFQLLFFFLLIFLLFLNLDLGKRKISKCQVN